MGYKTHGIYRKDLPIDPYLMGVLLGDGHLDDALEFTNLDPEIVQKTKTIIRTI